ncbi:hypothetical protein M2175_005335 [Bradyrhizobium elkanii]|uniref:Uncharacterized protein n=1 Tax=Bradyrhizobium japonicum TaxID=375 RepID=A0A1L3FFW6_BRAJP|nr:MULTISPECIES: hypothetical protein [Bradyrhizobium]APG12207.1 hypothetical protein BKD09_28120 [Bradyrhizobium japonicum]MCS3930304.1 hypothetical protein [Bradyrhizobium elkanii]MCS3970861.1 hypothetical protein [Bradyrhizobium japonicum]
MVDLNALTRANADRWSKAKLTRDRKPNHSYFVVMRGYGRKGMEAVVYPEITAAGVIERLKSGEWDKVVFIHRIADGLVEDVTDELIDRAEILAEMERAWRRTRG